MNSKKSKTCEQKVMHTMEKSCLKVIWFTIFIAFFIVLVIDLMNRTKLDEYLNDNGIKGVIDQFLLKKSCKKCDIWFSISVLWLVVEYLGVILPFELSAIILYLEYSGTNAKNRTIIMLSVFSMALIIMAYAIRPHDHMKGYRKAYVNLDYAINVYITAQDHDKSILIDALNTGEHLISRGYDIVSVSENDETEDAYHD